MNTGVINIIIPISQESFYCGMFLSVCLPNKIPTEGEIPGNIHQHAIQMLGTHVSHRFNVNNTGGLIRQNIFNKEQKKSENSLVGLCDEKTKYRAEKP